MHIKITLAALFVAAATFITTGCSTTSGGGTDPGTNAAPSIPSVNVQRTSNAVEVAAETGVMFAIRENPETRQYFTLALTTLDTLLTDAVIDPQRIREALAIIEAGEDENTWIAVTAGLNIYKLYFGDLVSRGLDSNDYARPVLNALRNGISNGLKVTLLNPPPAAAPKPNAWHWTPPVDAWAG